MCVHVCMCVNVYMYVCFIYMYACIYVYVGMYVYECVVYMWRAHRCVCACVLHTYMFHPVLEVRGQPCVWFLASHHFVLLQIGPELTK